MQRADSWNRQAAVCFMALLLVAASASAQEPALAMAQGRDIVELPSIGRVILVFLIVAGMAVGAAYALRRFSPNFARGLSQTGPLRVIDRASLSAGLRVHLIEVDGERILVAESRASVSLLQLRRPAQDRDQGSST